MVLEAETGPRHHQRESVLRRVALLQDRIEGHFQGERKAAAAAAALASIHRVYCSQCEVPAVSSCGAVFISCGDVVMLVL